jgi:CBS domain-containing protein
MSASRLLHDTEPFSTLPEQVFGELSAAAVERRYPANTHIFREKDAPTGFLYVIREGLVEITVMTPGGIDMVVDYRQEGSFLGGTPIFTGEPYTGGARTVKPTDCYLIPAEALRKAARDYPQLGEYFTRVVLSRVRHLYSEIVTEHSKQALTQVEAYPFKKRLSEIMATPVETCRPEESARQVARRLVEKKISSVLVTDAARKPLGIITEKDLVARVVAAEHADPAVLTAGELMKPHPYALAPDTYMYEAMAYMTGHRLKHLPVVDRGEVVGMVTLRDLMRYRSQKAMLLVGNVRDETTLEGLTAIRREIVVVARTLLSETRSTPEVMEIISYIHHSIIRRVFDLTLERMQAEGLQMPAVRYCFLLMGSGGRREMLLNPDQDHGFIFENVPDERMAAVNAFFVPFAERLVAALQQVGYPPCHGNVMASNPAWRGRLSDWQWTINEWVVNPEPQRVRYSSIFFDFVPLAGDPLLATRLRDIVNHMVRNYPAILYHMMALDLQCKVPLGLLGRFLPEKSGEHKGEISLKAGGSVFLVDCIRMFALEKEVPAITTLDRLKGLVERHVFAPETAEHIRAAFEALTFLRLRHEIRLVDQGREPSHWLDHHDLSKNEQDLLREALGAVSKLQDAAKRHFGRLPF